MSSVRVAIAATASRAIAVSTASAGESPQQNGPCPLTSTAGESTAVRPAVASASTMTRPVSASYSPVISAERSGRLTGTDPRKWSAWVVPRHGIGRPAWAHAVASRECVWTTPPIPGSSRYRSRWVGVSVDGRSDALDHRPVVEAHDHHVVGREPVVRHPRGLDDEDAGRAIDAAHVAERQHDEAGSPERDVGRGDGRLQVGEDHRRQPRARGSEPGRSARGIQTRIASTDRLAHAW